ncbi:MAG: valine--tRNA ligase [Terracidiphilus sp.]
MEDRSIKVSMDEQLEDSRIPKELNTAEVEQFCTRLWDDSGIYKFNDQHSGEMFSVDTPPPYVSASHLHVGHAMSYAQAEFIVRYHRMNGKQIFYPMGFDDNGLPTERYVEKEFKINKRKTTRTEFRALCLEVTQKGIAEYEKLWKALGLSVDWSLKYSTIDDHCRRTSQKSFLELFESGRIYRSKEPVLWDPVLETALAQADLESIERKGKLHEIAFDGPDSPNGSDLIIATTRPELLLACVALYCNEHDERYTHLIGKTAIVPIAGHSVPILADSDVDKDFGTGLMMVCTFGDAEDVRRWKRDKLETRIRIGTNGKLTDEAAQYAGLTTDEARAQIVKELMASGAHRGVKAIDQVVSVSERSGAPVEFIMAPQWFIRVLDMKEELLRRSTELAWFPDWMQVRLADWINGLKYDWNISRQRFYGVPIPIWFCEGCGKPVTATLSQLPVDPLEDACPEKKCSACGASGFRGDPDVMDTWMTSSLSPLINSNWAESPDRPNLSHIYPMTVRVQAFEIIRTWLFYTVVKSHLHTDSLPWKDVMISGWGLNENGKKISKKDLEQFTDAAGYNRYEPYEVIRKFGADALRYWAAGGSLGNSLRYNERDVQTGRKLAVKIWNAARFCDMQLKGFDPRDNFLAFSERTPEDRWVLIELNKIIPVMQEAFEGYRYHEAREAIDKYFWTIFCDDYLEMIKDRFWTPQDYSEKTRQSAQWTLWEALRTILGLYAPFLPFVTEYVYQRMYQPFESHVSLHVSSWPAHDPERVGAVPEMNVVSGILNAVRVLRSASQIGQTRRLAGVILDLDGASSDLVETVKSMHGSIRAAVRTTALTYGQATNASELKGVMVAIVP